MYLACSSSGPFFRRCAVIFAATAVFFSCSTTQMRAVWRDANYRGAPFKRIVVVALFKKLENRQNYENMIAQALRESGTDAVNSLALMSPEKEYEYGEMDKVFKAQKIDGILIVRISGVNRQRVYYPPHEDFVPYAGYSAYYNYYRRYYRVVVEPGYLRETDIFCLQCNLYANENDRLVWVGEARTVEPGISGDEPVRSVDDAASLASLVVESLKENGLIK